MEEISIVTWEIINYLTEQSAHKSKNMVTFSETKPQVVDISVSFFYLSTQKKVKDKNTLSKKHKILRLKLVRTVMKPRVKSFTMTKQLLYINYMAGFRI